MPQRPAPQLTYLTPRQLAYTLHASLYGGVHQNPRKCEAYCKRVCLNCGKVHACPAGN